MICAPFTAEIVKMTGRQIDGAACALLDTERGNSSDASSLPDPCRIGSLRRDARYLLTVRPQHRDALPF
jgi:hypothetical protein